MKLTGRKVKTPSYTLTLELSAAEFDALWSAVTNDLGNSIPPSWRRALTDLDIELHKVYSQ